MWNEEEIYFYERQGYEVIDDTTRTNDEIIDAMSIDDERTMWLSNIFELAWKTDENVTQGIFKLFYDPDDLSSDDNDITPRVWW